MTDISVTVVIPAHHRPQELRRAIAAVQRQEYAGNIEVVVVFDNAPADMSLKVDGQRPVKVLQNARTPGLAGARNTGILVARHKLIAFCDDDDYWHMDKLTRQVELMTAWPEAPLVTCSIEVNYEGKLSPRCAHTELVSYEKLVRSRMSMLHSSTFLFRKEALVGAVGLVDEEIPGSQNEDWDLLLRYAKTHPIPHVDTPLVQVSWGKSSFFSRKWDTKIASSIWMLDKYPDVADDNKAASRVMGQIAFAHSCAGERKDAWRWAWRALRRNPLQWRGVLSGLVAVVPRSGEYALGMLHRFGRGV